MIDLYEKFAYDYDEFGAIEDYLGDEAGFFAKLFGEHGVMTVFDCACGTGQHLFMLSEMGFEACGSDYSASMLNVARKNLSRCEKSIPLRQCDYRYLEQAYEDKFDAVVCLSTALPHMHTDEDLLLALRSMRGRLKKGGVLVLTQGATHYTLTLPSIEVVVNRADFSRVFVKEHDERFQTIHVLDLFHSQARTESAQYDIVYRIILDDDYRCLLSQAGYGDIRIYGSYDMAAYDEKSMRLIAVAVNA